MEDIQIKVSKNGLLIPVVNGVYLHSMYNPKKEAETFIQNNIHQIRGQKNFLVLGLGFGYHIEALIKEIGSRDYFINILEPSTSLINAFDDKRPLFDKNVVIRELSNVEELYKNINFSDFLAQKPVILSHNTSFNMNQDIFKKFLHFQASSFVNDYIDLIDIDIQYKFENHSPDKSLKDILSDIRKSSHILDTNDIFLLALDEIINNKDIVR